MADSKDLVGVIEEWFSLHGLDENFSGPIIVETDSKNDAVIVQGYLKKNSHPQLGPRYKYGVTISPRLKKGETHLVYELSVELNADY